MATTGTWDELFGGGRKWRVAEEMTGVVQARPADSPRGRRVAVKFTRGHFELPEGAAFRSPLSTNLGRRGLVLQETDASGETDIPGSRVAIGNHAAERVREQYSAIW